MSLNIKSGARISTAIELDAVIQAVARSRQSYNGFDCEERHRPLIAATDQSSSPVLAWECMAESEFIENIDELCALAPVTTAPIRHHVFVCSGKSCSSVGSAEVIKAFERELTARGLLMGKATKGKNPKGSVVLTECASVGFCAIGAAVLIYPDGVWYAQVRAADVPEIIESHLINSRIVERLALMRVPAKGSVEESTTEADWEV